MNTIEVKQRLFTNKYLFKLFLPLIIEQFLEFLVGLIDSIMVASVGESAVSGVSLVDFIMALLISIFASFATGGAVIIGQYLGSKQEDEARKASNQLVWFAGILGIVVMLLVYLLKNIIMYGLFGQITEEVYGHANIYLLFVAASIPFLALYNAGAALFRTMGNSKLPMRIMLTMNILHAAGNALLVFRFHMGTAGVAIPTLLSRIGAALIVIYLACNQKNVLNLKKTLKHKFDGTMLKRILNISVPYGIENGMFYFGRLLILSLVSTFGTASIAANSVGGTITTFEALPGMAIGLGMTVVISRCVGAADYEQAKHYTKKIIGIIYIAQIFSSIAVLTLYPTIIGIYGLSAEATSMITKIVWSHAIVMMLIWPLGNTLPITFRASGDAKFPMIISMTTMFLVRITLAYALVYLFNADMFITWVVVYCDWAVKAIIFIGRYISGKWTKFHAIS